LSSESSLHKMYYIETGTHLVNFMEDGVYVVHY